MPEPTDELKTSLSGSGALLNEGIGRLAASLHLVDQKGGALLALGLDFLVDDAGFSLEAALEEEHEVVSQAEEEGLLAASRRRGGPGFLFLKFVLLLIENLLDVPAQLVEECNQAGRAMSRRQRLWLLRLMEKKQPEGCLSPSIFCAWQPGFS